MISQKLLSQVTISVVLISLLLVGCIHVPESITVRLAPDGSGDYPNLAAAVDALPERSTIVLEPGVYRLEKPLNITKAIDLVGAGMDQTEIVSETEGYVTFFNGDGPFIVKNITFRYKGKELADVVVVAGGYVEFAGCRFTGGTAKRLGLLILGSTVGIVQDCVVEENGSGIGVGEQAQPTLEDNVCTDNTKVGIGYLDNAGGMARRNECTGNGSQGIVVMDQAHPTLEENFCANNGDSGIAYQGNSVGTASGNKCSGNRKYGIAVQEQAQPTLEENLCTDNERSGIAFFATPTSVARRNECKRNGLRGIYVGEDARPELEENICTDNGQDGIGYWDNAGGTALQNRCLRNGLSGISVNGQAQPILEGNLCTDNLDTGIAFFDNAEGVAHQNECARNRIGIYVEEKANPDLADNESHDNTEADVWDLRP